ncbi:hypothetical protein DFH08DRAFT_1025854 [Mycena albidolilacea]|uniref:Uncharacterized protein n=1 Tax=Mycena albidolilacea TaxID=1033008 RepID=A0AAD6ZKW5_9AGAR|nr:hypothetical protein DFH08DRAFT_1025854 [Mycena albidolilacea]
MQDAPETSAARCEAAVAAFKVGSKSRIATTLALHDILSEPAETSPGHAGPIPTPKEVESYMEPYEDMCDQWVRDQEEARVLGKRRTPGSGASGGGAGPGKEGEDGTGGLDNNAAADFDDDDDERPAKRRIVFDDGELPWVKNEPFAAAPLHADLAETVRLLTRIEFPESQWLHLLTNRALDLDAVFSSLYSLVPSTTHTETVGGIEFTFSGGESGKPSRSITRQSDWTLAWMQAIEAGLVVFSHLSEQYRVWGIFIMGKFAAVHESQHLRVIEFEKACRLLASSSMGRLTIEAGIDTSSCQKGQSSNGPGGGKTNAKAKARPAKSGEPCR